MMARWISLLMIVMMLAGMFTSAAHTHDDSHHDHEPAQVSNCDGCDLWHGLHAIDLPQPAVSAAPTTYTTGSLAQPDAPATCANQSCLPDSRAPPARFA